ncbi:MAG TPA: hypothetical protein ENI42_06195 [Thermoplasmatales archaeon]|nr:hypothetical protein [Thermoplasmatales archaeon]
MLKITCTLITCCILLTPILSYNVTGEKHIAKWTIMIYFAADNHRDPEINSTLKMLEDVGYNSAVNFVVLSDGKTFGDTKYQYLGKEGLVSLPWKENESDMGDAQTLETFLNLTMNDFPAVHYALFILSTHGSGWQGLGGDTHGTGSSKNLTLLDMMDYKTVLSHQTGDGFHKLDVIAFDICVTGMIEVAYQISPYAKYMIGTEEHGFGGEGDEGYSIAWNYSFFLNNLKNHPDTSPEEFAASIVNCYTPGTYTFKLFNTIEAPRWYPILKCYTTLSAVNLSKIQEVTNLIDGLSLNLSTNLQKYKKDIKFVRKEVREYGKLYRKFWFLPYLIYSLHPSPLGYNCFIDIYDFVEKLHDQIDDNEIKANCENIMSSLRSAVIANKSLPTDASHGLSIYFPEYRCQYDVSIWCSLRNKNFWRIPVSYNSISFSQDTHWDDFLRMYLNI